MQSATLFVRRQEDEKIIERESYIEEEADLVISFTALPGQRFIHDDSGYFRFVFVKLKSIIDNHNTTIFSSSFEKL
jgi:hypothetical protein